MPSCTLDAVGTSHGCGGRSAGAQASPENLCAGHRHGRNVRGRVADAVAEALRLIGPIQAQTARSPFVGLAARVPGVTAETITSP